jgi:hypothetical protein
VASKLIRYGLSRQQKSLGEEDEEVSVLDGEINQAEGSSSDQSDTDQEMKEIKPRRYAQV